MPKSPYLPDHTPGTWNSGLPCPHSSEPVSRISVGHPEGSQEGKYTSCWSPGVWSGVSAHAHKPLRRGGKARAGERESGCELAPCQDALRQNPKKSKTSESGPIISGHYKGIFVKVEG